VRAVLGWLGLGLVLCGLTMACEPTAAPAAPTPSDPFAVVRATSQAAYQAGETALNRGDYLQACVDFDAAKTNDPDNRPDIQQALEQALAQCLTPQVQATSPPPAAAQRTLVVATISAGVGGTLATTPVSGVATPAPAATPDAAAAASPAVSPTVVAAAPTSPATGLPATGGGASAATPNLASSPVAAGALVTWNDPQGRFSIGAPSNWVRADQVQTLVGTGVVEFHDPTGRAEVDVAVDTNGRAVSPELYAAKLEVDMQQQVPGYAGEQVVPGQTAGVPSVRRVFTFTQRDASGQDHQARGFQVALVRGSTPYLISGTAPAEQFQQYSPIFDQIVGSFRFS
jgi:hypothetical protein